MEIRTAHAKPRCSTVSEIVKAKVLYLNLLADSTEGNSDLPCCAVWKNSLRHTRLGHNDSESRLIEIGSAVVSVFRLV
jgi:hypothetical protein